MVFAAVAALQPGGMVRAIVRDGLWTVAPARKYFMLVELGVTFLLGGSEDRFFRKKDFTQ